MFCQPPSDGRLQVTVPVNAWPVSLYLRRPLKIINLFVDIDLPDCMVVLVLLLFTLL
jgi:hypothetical protein